MHTRFPSLGEIAILTAAAFALAGCEQSTAQAKADPPAILQPQPGGVARITLKPKAMERLGIQFAEVGHVGKRLEAPYSALVYDAKGGEWFYVNPEPNVFTRIPVKVELIEGERVYYTQGPAEGTKLVTTGVALLLGIELGIK